jgi:hypothetical protein
MAPNVRDGGLVVGVSNLAPTSKFIARVPGFRGVSGGRKIYTGSSRTSLLPAIDALRYRYH